MPSQMLFSISLKLVNAEMMRVAVDVYIHFDYLGTLL